MGSYDRRCQDSEILASSSLWPILLVIIFIIIPIIPHVGNKGCMDESSRGIRMRCEASFQISHGLIREWILFIIRVARGRGDGIEFDVTEDPYGRVTTSHVDGNE